MLPYAGPKLHSLRSALHPRKVQNAGDKRTLWNRNLSWSGGSCMRREGHNKFTDRRTNRVHSRPFLQSKQGKESWACGVSCSPAEADLGVQPSQSYSERNKTEGTQNVTGLPEGYLLFIKGLCSNVQSCIFSVVLGFFYVVLIFSYPLCSQMSNLMNQARLKVLRARDDLITVSSS